MTPDTWPSVSLKRLLRFGNGTDHASVENSEGKYRVFGSGGPFALADDFLYDGESVLFGRKGTVDKPRYVDEPFWAVDTVYFTIIGPELVPRWLYYWAMTIPFAKYSTNTALPSMTSGVLGSLRLKLPPVAQQEEIVAFLDRETAQIDAMIKAQTDLLHSLQERRESYITWAFHGLETIPLKRLINPARPLTYGILQAGKPQITGVPYIGPADIPGEGMAPKRDDLRLTTEEIAARYSRSVLVPGDIVVSIGPAYGRVMVTTDELEGANLTQDTARVALINMLADSKFVVWALCSSIASEYWDKMINGATFRRLNLGTLGDTPIPFTSLEEQRRIVERIEKDVKKTDRMIAETLQLTELLRERREALITAAVTGHIDPHTGIERMDHPDHATLINA